jgi:ubiquinone/menaquinone biosynthesis C-methylase UbiE
VGAIKWLGLAPYSDDLKSRFTGRHKLSIELARALPGSEVLDVGSSFGWFESSFGNGSGAKISAVEIDAKSLEQAQRNVPAGDFVHGSALALPFADASFDAAVMFEVLEHLPRGTEVTALREIARVLRPNGRLLLSTPYAHPVSMLLDPAWYFGHRHYSKSKLHDLFSQAGFEITSLAVRGGIWEIAGVLSLYAFKWILRAEPPFKAFVERRREHEFCAAHSGFTTIFVEARVGA